MEVFTTKLESVLLIKPPTVFEDFRGPVLFGFPIGHTKSPALTLPLGVQCRVIADRTPRLVIEEAAVE